MNASEKYRIKGLVCFFLLLPVLLKAQMVQGGDTLYGPEWIRYDQTYFKFYISKDSLYQIRYADLVQAGIPVSQVNGAQWQLWRMGSEVPLFVSSPGTWSEGDYMQFWGRKNRSDLDAFLFSNPAREMLNPEYSLYTDSMAYFLTWVTPGITTRRVTLRPSNAALSVQDYVWVDRLYEFHRLPFDQRYDSENIISYSTYDACEGFGNGETRLYNQVIPAASPYAGNINGKLQIRLATNARQHDLRISINNVVQLIDSFWGFQVKNYELDIPNQTLAEDINLKIEGLATSLDYFILSNIRLVYPKRTGIPLMGGETLQATGSPFLTILQPGLTQAILIHPDGTSWTQAVNLNNQDYLEIPQVTDTQQVYISEAAAASTIVHLDKIVLDPLLSEPNSDYIIINHKSLQAGTQEYASYRQSSAGGGFQVRIVDVEQIYDQFAYGIPRHVIGLRNFGHYIARKWAVPKYLLLIGRALNYRDLRVNNNIDQYGYLHLIPTFGYPGADNLIFASYNSLIPVLPFGRIAATKNEEVITYLNKVKEYEGKLKNPSANEDLFWRKKVLHMAGGSPQERFDSYLASMKEKIENNAFHALVTTVTKTSSDPVQGGLSEIIKNAVNNGVALKVYLGHGATSATEIGLDNPDLFDNEGKYPLSFSLGCLTGNMHTTGISLSEAFVLSPKGTIGYIASSGFGYPYALSNYGNEFYNLLGNNMYTGSIGNIHRESLRKFDRLRDFPTYSLNQQLSYHGDPAVQLNYYSSPDFTMDYSSFKFEPANVQSDQDSLRFSVDVWNIGKYSGLPLKINVEHELPDGRKFVFPFSIVLQKTFETVNFSLPLPLNTVGINTLRIILDPDNEFNELPAPFAENNNQLRDNTGNAGIPFPVYSNEARPVHPKNFGITGDADLVLKAYSSNAFGPEADYYFEIDTTPLFSSSLKRAATAHQHGGMIQWRPGLALSPNTVYYWRVAADTVDTNRPLIWNESSFVYLPGQGPGWNQSHHGQFVKHEASDHLQYDPDSMGWSLIPESVSFVASSINQSVDAAEFSKVLVNGIRVSRNNRTENAEFMITIWDAVRGELQANPVEGRDGAMNVFGRPVAVFTFPMDMDLTQERANLIRFLEQGVKPGQYVILNNFIQPGYSYFPEKWAEDSLTLGKNLFTVLESKGARLVRNLVDFNSFPYVFIYQEGGEVIDEAIADDGLSVRSSFDLPKNRSVGQIQSITIGPAVQWKKFEWAHADPRPPEANVITIYGLKSDGLDTLLKSFAPSIDLSFINAQTYKHIRLEWQVTDTSKKNQIGLKFWRVFYTGYPDLALNTNEDFEFYKDTLDRGDDARIRFLLENVGDFTTDSNRVTFSLTDPQNITTRDTLWTAPLGPGQKQSISKTFSTDQRSKLQTLVIEARSINGYPDLIELNNTGSISFYVVDDLVPPTVSVLFDGRQILNNEIVSRQPFIQIDLSDNKLFSPDDTAQIELSLKYPGTDQFVRIPARDYILSVSGNQASVTYRPGFVQTGSYTLRVQARDRSGNDAGRAPYEIDFKVITENTVSAVLPYPNPFSTQCRFAYTLTGEKPAVFKIQVLTVNGRVVRELTEFDLGPLQEGTHLTERAWDGHDEYGNKLANGTYLYRIVMKDNQGKSYSSFEDFEDSGGQDARRFFTKGLGKLVILR